MLQFIILVLFFKAVMQIKVFPYVPGFEQMQDLARVGLEDQPIAHTSQLKIDNST